jgi:hypothetical protein
MALREAGCVSVEWIQLAQDRGRWWALVNMVMNLRVLVPQSYLLSSLIEVDMFHRCILGNEQAELSF